MNKKKLKTKTQTSQNQNSFSDARANIMISAFAKIFIRGKNSIHADYIVHVIYLKYVLRVRCILF